MIGHRRIKVYEDNGHVHESDLYLPNIKSVVGFLEGVWDFSMYDTCFEGKNRISDIDGGVEYFGHTMLIEFKKSREALTRGQLLHAIRRAKHCNITTFFVFGETNRPVELLRFSPGCIEGTGFIKCDIISLGKEFTKWAKWAKKNTKVTDSDTDWTITQRYLNAVGGGKKS